VPVGDAAGVALVLHDNVVGFVLFLFLLQRNAVVVHSFCPEDPNNSSTASTCQQITAKMLM
jgi:hypothetical protein